MFNVKTALVLAPHTDDGELGSGGTIARLVEMGVSVHYAAFSICETSVPAGFPSDILAVEVQAATRILGIAPDDLFVYRFPVRQFPQHRQQILDHLIVLRRQIQPEIVLLPSRGDVHQDHQVVSQEGIRAFKDRTILGYQLPWNNLELGAAGLVVLDDRHIDKKVEAMQAYRSQAHRSYTGRSPIESLARVCGQQAGSEYAEAFEVIRWILR